MDFTFVMTFPDRYEYAFQNLKAAEKYLPKNGNILVQFESENMPLPESTKRVKWQWLPLEKINAFKKLSIKVNNKVKIREKGTDISDNNAYTDREMWRWDAFRFCHKVYAQYHSLAHSNRYMCYIDSDVIFHKPVPEDFFYTLFEDGKYVSYINRESGPHLTPDTGYVGFDTSNPLQTEFWDEMLRLYDGGKIFEKTQGWTDCQALDHCIKHIGNSAKKLITAEQLSWNSWKATPLSKYCTHHKGDFFKKASA